MSTVILRGGRGLRSDMSAPDLFPGAKRVISRKYQKAVRRDAKHVIEEQLQDNMIELDHIREESLRQEAEEFWLWDDIDDYDFWH